MNTVRYRDRHRCSPCYACRAVFFMGIVLLLLLSFISELEAQEKLPRWYYELPVSNGIYFAIGECGKYDDQKKQWYEARQLAAFRLAASMSTTIRFGEAEDASEVGTRQVSFVAVTIDTSRMDALLNSMTILDSLQCQNKFSILVSTSKPEQFPNYYRELITLREIVPQWVKFPPSDTTYIYGIGSSWKNGVSGFEEAERMARADIAAQIRLNVKTGSWNIIDASMSLDQTLSKRTFETQIFNTQVIKRALDDNGTSYVLIRMARED